MLLILLSVGMLSPKICSAAVFLSDMAYTNVDIDVLFWIIVFGKFSVEFRGILGGFSAKTASYSPYTVHALRRKIT